ncbi:MAG TPA: hypothetical protein VFE62_13375, partial [Gemmataceae bacterium]|nr:hypothetical protein [Gemmataceae bacterium]
RKGKTLYCLAAEPGKEFVLLQQSEFGVKDLRHVRLVGVTGGPQAALDVLVTDVRIRADGFTKAGATPPPAPAAPPAPPPSGRSMWIIAAVAGPVLILLASAGAVGVWLVVRRRRSVRHAEPGAEEPVDSVRFACGKCGRKLKVKADKAGKKASCPRCAAIVSVPEIETAESGES